MVKYFNEIYEKEEIVAFKYQGGNVVQNDVSIIWYLQAKRSLRLLGMFVFLLHEEQDIAYKQAGKQLLADHSHCRGYFGEQDMLLFSRGPSVESITKIYSREIV